MGVWLILTWFWKGLKFASNQEIDWIISRQRKTALCVKHQQLGVNSIGLKTVRPPFRCLLRCIFRRISGVKSSWAPI